MAKKNGKYTSEEARYNEIREMNLTGIRLRELREEKGWSLEHVAVLLDNKYSSSVLGKHERGERHPKRKCLEDLAEVYGVDINYLLGMTHVRTREGFDDNAKDSGVSTEEKKLDKNFSKCDEKEKNLIFYVLRTFLNDGE